LLVVVEQVVLVTIILQVVVVELEDLKIFK
jgi:hypothetical protein